jgi:hypothetical protein
MTARKHKTLNNSGDASNFISEKFGETFSKWVFIVSPEE